MVGLGLQQGHHALGKIVIFTDTGAVLLETAIVELAAVPLFAGFEDYEATSIGFPEKRR
jgi:hypothetical protein